MHLALYRSERPERFSEIIGQQHIVRILQNQIKTGDVAHAYLFTGTRGTGKTTTARILAKALNCLGNPEDGEIPCCECENCREIKAGRFIDVIELDAASQNGVGAMRDLIDSMQYPPRIGKYKIYIIDEVHMLSSNAENAFLKTLEEPPENVIFILATTNPEKVRETIRSRCMRLDFRRISEDDLFAGMKRICQRKNIQITDGALQLIAQKGDGSARDSLSILEQCIMGRDELVDVDEVLEYTGSAGLDFYLELTQSVLTHDMSSALSILSRSIRAGRDPRMLIADWLEHYRNLMVVRYVDKPQDLINSSAENIERMRAQASQLNAEMLETSIRLLSEYVNLMRYSTQPRILLETAVLHMMDGKAKPASQVSEMLQMKPAEHQRVKAIPIINKVTPEILAQSKKASDLIASQPQAKEPTETPISAESTVPVDKDSEIPMGAGYRAIPILKSAPAEKPIEKQTGAPANTPTESWDLQGMWEQIVDDLSQEDVSFKIFVGNNSHIEEFHNGQMVLRVKPTKIPLAEDKKEAIQESARNHFGSHVFLIIRPDDGTGTASENPDPVQTGTLRKSTKPANSAPIEASTPSAPEPTAPASVEKKMPLDTGSEGDEVSIPSDYIPGDCGMTMDEGTSASNGDVIDQITEEAGDLFGIPVQVIE
ncbi:MAG: DNA polymerase III subunit gamma/tau [Eubacteriales bacterium]|nr:DNA polymerase III subunit gamma/tau [Eubacteriales bacterium]